jgi:hypothetical protein
MKRKGPILYGSRDPSNVNRADIRNNPNPALCLPIATMNLFIFKNLN